MDDRMLQDPLIQRGLCLEHKTFSAMPGGARGKALQRGSVHQAMCSLGAESKRSNEVSPVKEPVLRQPIPWPQLSTDSYQINSIKTLVGVKSELFLIYLKPQGVKQVE